MKYLSSDYILSKDFNFLKNGILIIDDNDTIIELLDPENDSEAIKCIEKTSIEIFQGLITPGFINTHCHLELSYLKNQVKEKTGLPGFISEVEQKKKEKSEYIIQCIEEAEQEMIKNGIVAVGDISNTDYSIQQKTKSNIYYHTFVESYASNKIYANKAFNRSLKLYETFQAINSNKNSASITPHAPYSVSDLLFNKLSEWIINNNGIVSIHNQESESENEMFISGTGKLAQFIKSFGSEINDFIIGKHSIYNVFDKLPKKNNIQFVHNTYSTAEDIAAAKIIFEKSFWCVCPNANLYIENKLPDVAALVRENCKITIGTDSLASNHQLSILEELKTIQTQFNFLPLNELLKWATLNGAEFLGIDKFYGSFEKGKKPRILLLKNLDYVGMNIRNDSTIKVIN